MYTHTRMFEANPSSRPTGITPKSTEFYGDRTNSTEIILQAFDSFKAEIRSELHDIRSEFRSEMTTLRDEFHHEISEIKAVVRCEIDVMQSRVGALFEQLSKRNSPVVPQAQSSAFSQHPTHAAGDPAYFPQSPQPNLYNVPMSVEPHISQVGVGPSQPNFDVASAQQVRSAPVLHRPIPTYPPCRMTSDPTHLHAGESHMHACQSSNATRNLNNTTIEDVHVRVKAFNSKEIDWLDYKQYFLQIARKANWSDNTCCVKLLAVLDSSLLGITSGFTDNYTFDDLLVKLDQVNGADFAKREALNKLSTIKRNERETIHMYAERVRRLVNHAFGNYSPPAKDEQALKYFIDGLPSKRNFKLNMKLKGFTNLHDAVSHAALLDHVLAEEAELRPSGYARAVKTNSHTHAENSFDCASCGYDWTDSCTSDKNIQYSDSQPKN